MSLPNSSDVAGRLASALGDRYEVEREVGSGGMAIVFAARDIRHNRTVAVKVLRPELAVSLGAERFLREIELAAGLQHPHIVPVYDSGAGDGLLFYVMPLVDGEPLSARIAREGALPVAEATRIAREIAGALAYAHERGIIHRDIKPENILLSGNHALVADFGIARAVQSAAAGGITATGMAVGTPMYMSPEQALGSADVDARSDIYSLGCVLYEMLTGQQPFSGVSLQAILAQSITAPRPRARKIRRDVPVAVDDVVVTALAKEPTDRYATAAAFDAALAAAESGVGKRRSWKPALAGAAIALVVAAGAWKWRAAHVDGEASVRPDARVIAVFPFSATGDDATKMADGLVDLISTNLDGVGGIRTINPRTTLGRWRARAGGATALDRPAALAVGRDVEAGAIVIGNVVTVGAHVRVTAELVDVNGAPLAKAQADGAPDSVLAVVDTLSVRLLRDIWRSTSPVPELRVSAVTTGSLPAMRAYLDGEQRFRRSDWAGAERAYSHAIELDSSFALAYLRLLTTDEWLGVDAGSMRALGAMIRLRLDRLSPRDRSQAVGELLYHEGQLAALDTARALTIRYPDDLRAWMLLGETRYHARALVAPTLEELRTPFERVLSLDSTLTSVRAHLLDVSAMFGDSARFFHDLDRMRATLGAADTTVTLYSLFGDAEWGSATSATAAMRTIFQERPSVRLALTEGALVVPGVAARLDSVLARTAGTPRGDTAQLYRIPILLAMGRVAEAKRATAALIAALPDLQAAYTLGALPLFMGIADTTTTLEPLRAAMRRWASRSFGGLSTAEYGVATRDTTLMRRGIDQVLSMDTVRLPPRWHAIYEIIPGWARITLGDSAAGARSIGDVLARTDFTLVALTKSPRFARAVTLARQPATRTEGIRLLRYSFGSDPEYFGAAQLALREALLAAGDRQGADSAAAAFERLWRGADPAARAAAERSYPRAFVR